MKLVYLTVATFLVGASHVSAGGIDLDLGASVSIGHKNVAADVDIGSGKADVSASLGHSHGSHGSGFGHSGDGTGGGHGGDVNAGGDGAKSGKKQGSSSKLAASSRASYVGRLMVSSDGIVLGRVTDVRPSKSVCPNLGIKINPGFALGDQRVWVTPFNCGGEDAIELSMSSSSFVTRLSN